MKATIHERKIFALKMASQAPKGILLMPLRIDYKEIIHLCWVYEYAMDRGLKDACWAFLCGVRPIVHILIIWPLMLLFSPIMIPILARRYYRSWMRPGSDFDDRRREYETFNGRTSSKEPRWFIGYGWNW